jgi:hypothetical protein
VRSFCRGRPKESSYDPATASMPTSLRVSSRRNDSGWAQKPGIAGLGQSGYRRTIRDVEIWVGVDVVALHRRVRGSTGELVVVLVIGQLAGVDGPDVPFLARHPPAPEAAPTSRLPAVPTLILVAARLPGRKASGSASAWVTIAAIGSVASPGSGPLRFQVDQSAMPNV